MTFVAIGALRVKVLLAFNDDRITYHATLLFKSLSS